MLFKSAIVTVASGSLGGLTASHNKGGMYLRARTIPTNPSTAGQVIVRAALGTLASDWLNVLTQEQRDAWDVYAFNTPLTGPLGDPRTVSGLDMYIRSNVSRIQAGLATVDDGPVTFTLGTFTPTTLVTVLDSTQLLLLTIEPLDAWALQSGSGLMVYVSRPQNVTINYFKGPYQFAGLIEGDATPPTSPQGIPVPFVITAGQKLFYRIRSTELDGRLSTSQFASAIVA